MVTAEIWFCNLANNAHRLASAASEVRSNNNARQDSYGYTNLSKACISGSQLRFFHVCPSYPVQ